MNNYHFYIVVKEDDKTPQTFHYNNAIKAVNAFNSFIDHGTAKNSRTIFLTEPNGEIHEKTFSSKWAQTPVVRVLSSTMG